MPVLLVAIDLLAILAALVASVLWYQAGSRPVRRVSKFEELDAADLNRLVVAMNRAAILNRRAALATAASTAFLALDFAVHMAVGG